MSRTAGRLSAVGVFVVCGVSALGTIGAPPIAAQTRTQTQASTLEIPVVPGLAFVLAVHAPDAAAAGSRIAKGDYEMVVAVSDATDSALTLQTRIDAAQDESGKAILVSIDRRVPATDIASARLQILGFHTKDPRTIDGSTSLGPSLAVM